MVRPVIVEGRVLVTGATSGIGRATVEAIVAAGGTVAAVGRDEDALGALAVSSPNIVPMRVDLIDPVATGDLVARAAAELGALDGLVHAAGVARHAPLQRIAIEDLDAAVRLHLATPIQLLSGLAEHLVASGRRGAAVLVSSTLAHAPAENTAVYAATKAGLNVLVRTFAAELAEHRIAVNAVAPGVVDTKMIRDMEPGARETLAKRHRLGGIGRPEDVAAAIVHLLDAPWTTGAIHVVDGGLTAASDV